MGLYSSGTNTSGVLGHGPETKQCVTFTPILFPFPSRVVQVSASHNHAAFVTEAGEVFQSLQMFMFSVILIRSKFMQSDGLVQSFLKSTGE